MDTPDVNGGSGDEAAPCENHQALKSPGNADTTIASAIKARIKEYDARGKWSQCSLFFIFAFCTVKDRERIIDVSYMFIGPEMDLHLRGKLTIIL